MDYASPLRYPGGKRKLLDFFSLFFRFNNLQDSTYLEPFAGGAGLALSLLFRKYAKEIHLNDIDRSIFAFWYSVLNFPEELCKKVEDTNVTMEEWYKQHEVQAHSSNVSSFDLGFSTLFLNRTNRSGIIKGGVIGGKEQSGRWKLNARYRKDKIISRIMKVASYKEQIRLYNLDALDFIEMITKKVPDNSILYLDPPYISKARKLYTNYYSNPDHIKVANYITTLKSKKWVVSYDNVELLKELYSGYRSIEYSLNYSAFAQTKGSEIMFFSDTLQIPPLSDISCCSYISNIKIT